MPRNVFVLGLDPFNLETMHSLREARRYNIYPLLPHGQVLRAQAYDFDELLAEADAELAAFNGVVDAVTTWWDFPSSALAPALAERWDLYGPELRSVAVLEHKYWGRMAQRAVATEHVPAFAAFDPFAPDALHAIRSRGVEFPFWIKPVKSVRSYLGFHIEDEAAFDTAMLTMREHINSFGDPFDQVLARIELPPDVEVVGGVAGIAESIISGQQCTLEGYVCHGTAQVYGTVDSHRLPGRSTFESYRYPSQLGLPIQQRMTQIATEVVYQAGLDHSCFNAEFFYDRETGHIWLLEINTRLSQSHCDLFAKVDGASSQRAMLDVAQGRPPRMPKRQGDFGAAGKFFLRSDQDGLVTRVPSAGELDAVKERFPGTRIDIEAREGMRLAELPMQDSYSYELGRVYLGAADHDELQARYETVTTMLPFEIDHRRLEPAAS